MNVKVNLEAPSFLIAVPQLGDPNFFRSVVLLLEHNDEGTMGLVINRPSELNIDEFCKSQGIEYRGDGEQLVHMGGPVQTDRAFILHSPGFRGPETETIIEGLNLSYSLESLRGLAESSPSRMRIYMGYAGWGPGQLASEISEGSWLVLEASDKHVFNPLDEETWELALRDLGVEPLQLMHSDAVH